MVEIHSSSTMEEADPFAARLRVRPPRQPRRPATSGGGSASRSSRALAVTTPRGDGRLPTLADTLDAFIHNQWALPNAGLRSPSPTQQHQLPYQHHHTQEREAAATPRPLPRPTSSPPRRHQSPDRLLVANNSRINSPDGRRHHHHVTNGYDEVRPRVIGQASSHHQDSTPIATSSPSRRQHNTNSTHTASELRHKLERFDEQVYTGDVNSRRNSPMRGGGGHGWSEQIPHMDNMSNYLSTPPH